MAILQRGDQATALPSPYSGADEHIPRGGTEDLLETPPVRRSTRLMLKVTITTHDSLEEVLAAALHQLVTHQSHVCTSPAPISPAHRAKSSSSPPPLVPRTSHIHLRHPSLTTLAIIHYRPRSQPHITSPPIPPLSSINAIPPAEHHQRPPRVGNPGQQARCSQHPVQPGPFSPAPQAPFHPEVPRPQPCPHRRRRHASHSAFPGRSVLPRPRCRVNREGPR